MPARVHLTGYVEVPAPRWEEVLAALPAHVAATRAEAGNERFVVTPEVAACLRLRVEETFHDRAAFDAHQARARASAWGRVTHGLPRTYYLIRSAVPGDRAALSAIYDQGRRDALVPGAEEQAGGFADDTEDEHLLVAERDGTPVGFASVWEPDAFLHHLYVLRAHQGHGAGAGLLRAARALAETSLRLKCVAENERALRFYERHGGVIRETVWDPTDGPHHVVELPAHSVASPLRAPTESTAGRPL